MQTKITASLLEYKAARTRSAYWYTLCGAHNTEARARVGYTLSEEKLNTRATYCEVELEKRESKKKTQMFKKS